MIFVVDVSVAIKWFVAETLRENARLLLKDRQRLIAPTFMAIELANVAWKKSIRGEIDKDQALLIADRIMQPAFITDFIDDSVLRIRALEIALNWKHPVYDCLYIACAEETDATLVTADDRLVRLLSSRSPTVRHVPLAQIHSVLGS
jgi:predicted nucleic acid-binding protein